MFIRGLCIEFIMIIKDIAKQGIPEIGNILPLKKNNTIPIKINKSIEIVCLLYTSDAADE